MTRLLIVRLVTAALLIGSSFSFLPVSHHPHRFTPLYASGVPQGDNFLLQEFRLHNGEVLNPYSVLKVPRNAELSEVKATYRKLSRRFHPDIMRHKDILPGSCNNLEEVRDEWERIKLAYEILKDTETRKRYDRHEMIADPKAAIGRVASDAAWNGIKGFGKGMFDIGAFAVNQIVKSNNEQDKHA